MIEDEDEEDKEIMEVLGAEEVETELYYEVDSEVTKKREKENMKPNCFLSYSINLLQDLVCFCVASDRNIASSDDSWRRRSARRRKRL